MAPWYRENKRRNILARFWLMQLTIAKNFESYCRCHSYMQPVKAVLEQSADQNCLGNTRLPSNNPKQAEFDCWNAPIKCCEVEVLLIKGAHVVQSQAPKTGSQNIRVSGLHLEVASNVEVQHSVHQQSALQNSRGVQDNLDQTSWKTN